MNSSPSRDSHQNLTTPKGKRRPFFGRVRAVFQRLFRRGKKNKAVRDSEEINPIPHETTDSKDILSVPERETEATSGTEHVHASKIDIGVTSGTDGAHQKTTEEMEFTISVETKDGLQISIPTESVQVPESGIEITATTNKVSISQDKNQSTDAAETTISSDSIYFSAESEITTETALIPESSIEIKDNRIDSDEEIQSIKTTEIVEAVPIPTDGIKSTGVELVADPKDGMEISIPTETALIPESSVLRGKESVPPLTTEEEPAEDKPHPSGESVQATQQNATPARKRQSFCSRVRACFHRMRRKGIKKKQSTISVPTVKSFKYHEHIGEGMFAKVFLASHRGIDQLLAIKVAQKPSDSFDTLLLERKAMEVTGASRFFPQLYATFQAHNFLFYVMEYVNGGTLREFIDERNPLDFDTIKFIAAELLCAIQFLHSRGIAHCDLHLQNVLLDRTGHMKIIDFGEAKMTGVPFCPDTKIDEVLREPWCHYLCDYVSFRNIIHHMVNVEILYHEGDTGCQLLDLLKECMFLQANLRQHPFFEGMNWNELEAGNVRPPYIMEPSPKVNRSKKIKLDFSKCKNDLEISDASSFDFVSDQWKEMLQHKEVRNQDQPRFIPNPKVRHHCYTHELYTQE